MSINLTIVSAKGLRSVWPFVKNQPLAVAWVNPFDRRSTKVAVDGGSNPVWDAMLSIPVDESFLLKHDSMLRIQIFHRGMFFCDKPIGMVQIPLREVVELGKNGSGQAVAYPVKGPFGRIHGSLDVIVQMAKDQKTAEARRRRSTLEEELARSPEVASPSDARPPSLMNEADNQIDSSSATASHPAPPASASPPISVPQAPISTSDLPAHVSQPTSADEQTSPAAPDSIPQVSTSSPPTISIPQASPLPIPQPPPISRPPVSVPQESASLPTPRPPISVPLASEPAYSLQANGVYPPIKSKEGTEAPASDSSPAAPTPIPQATASASSTETDGITASASTSVPADSQPIPQATGSLLPQDHAAEISSDDGSPLYGPLYEPPPRYPAPAYPARLYPDAARLYPEPYKTPPAYEMETEATRAIFGGKLTETGNGELRFEGGYDQLA